MNKIKLEVILQKIKNNCIKMNGLIIKDPKYILLEEILEALLEDEK